jgi:hypothetical protein
MGSWAENTGSLTTTWEGRDTGDYGARKQIFLIRYPPSSTYSHGLQGLGDHIVTWSYLARTLVELATDLITYLDLPTHGVFLHGTAEYVDVRALCPVQLPNGLERT